MRTHVVITGSGPSGHLRGQFLHKAAGLEFLFKSTAAQTALAENYLGLPH